MVSDGSGYVRWMGQKSFRKARLFIKSYELFLFFGKYYSNNSARQTTLNGEEGGWARPDQTHINICGFRFRRFVVCRAATKTHFQRERGLAERRRKTRDEKILCKTHKQASLSFEAWRENMRLRKKFCWARRTKPQNPLPACCSAFLLLVVIDVEQWRFASSFFLSWTGYPIVGWRDQSHV